MTSPSFLEKLASHILSNYKDKTAQLTVLFPNKRAGLFLKNALAKQIKHNIWLPRIMSIEEAFADWSGLSLADPLHVQFELARIHLENAPEKASAIGEFMGLAAQMASEFEDIDQSLADAASIFNYLNEVKAIEMWHPDGSPLLESELKYIQFFKSLRFYYDQLKKNLENAGLAYQGMLSAKLASLEEAELLSKIGQKQLIFAGFNALTKAEEKIVSTFVRAKKAEIIWDIDKYYIEKQAFGLNEAGQFVREYLQNKSFPAPQFLTEDLVSQPKHIEIIAVAGNVSQAKALSQRLAQQTENNHQKAVVLADEKLLLPVLNSIPESYESFNVTMGFPFIYGVVYQYLKLLFELQYLRKPGQESNKFFVWPFLSLLNHELNQALFSESDRKVLKNLSQKLSASGIIFFDFSQIEPVISGHPELQTYFLSLLTHWENQAKKTLSALDSLLPLMISLVEKNSPSASGMMVLNQISIAGRIFNRIKPLLEMIHAVFDARELATIFNSIAQQQQVAFYGEPLQGLQIMGLLESRNLDFDEIHLLSVNEGILPKEKNYGSMIPADIRKTFQLPGYQNRQAVFAYHFYRLLQKADRIHLYFNDIPGEMGGGEPSQFVLQLLHELQQVNPKITITNSSFQLPLPIKKTSDQISIEKTADVLQNIRTKLENGLSPTALITYIGCPLKFYFQHVLKITDTTDDRVVAQNVLGSVVHLCLENLFKPFEGKQISAKAIAEMRPHVEKEIETAFRTVFEKGIPAFGRNVLVKEVAIQMVNSFLLADEQRIKSLNDIYIIGLEKKIESKFNINGNSLKLKGFVDRIESSSNSATIIDYKTGKVLPKDLQLKEWEKLRDYKSAKIIQLLFYRYLVSKSDSTLNGFSPDTAIFSLRSPSQGLLHPSYPTDDQNEINEQTSILLKDIISEMFDPEIPINQTTETDICSYCEFATICNRYPTNNYSN